jgi:2-methylaconitate isomerase
MGFRATWMRGGTSKCWVFDEQVLSTARDRDALLARLFGSPDVRQIDGIGGGTSTTSKAVLLSVSHSPGVDVDYTFAQVSVTEPRVDWSSNCGNCSTVAGLYALQAGWMQPAGDVTPVRVLNTNTDQLIRQEVPTPGGQVTNDGDTVIAGVPYPGLGVKMGFVEPAGRTTGRLFPTGSPSDRVSDGQTELEVTMVDAGAPVVAVPAATVGLTGTESPEAIDADTALLARLERIRVAAAHLMGLARGQRSVPRAIPKVALVGPPAEQQDIAGRAMAATGHDFSVRMLSMGRTHPALAITGSVALALAATTPGTVLSGLLAGAHAEGRLQLATPSGVLPVWVEHSAEGQVVSVLRTTRRLLTADIDVPEPHPSERVPAPAFAVTDG